MISSNLHSHPCDVICLSRLLYFFAHLSPVVQSYETYVHIRRSGRHCQSLFQYSFFLATLQIEPILQGGCCQCALLKYLLLQPSFQIEAPCETFVGSEKNVDVNQVSFWKKKKKIKAREAQLFPIKSSLLDFFYYQIVLITSSPSKWLGKKLFSGEWTFHILRKHLENC